MCDAAVLLTSETVTNAIIHGGTSVMLTVCARQDGVRVEVSDGNRSQPLLQRADLDSLGGRGLGIVTATAARWGVSDLQIGKTVWFELAHPAEGPIQP